MKINFYYAQTLEFSSIEEFQTLYPAAEIVSIDDRELQCYCESCGTPILTGDLCQEYKDHVLTCASPDCSDINSLIEA